MKKTFILCITALAALLTVSCAREVMPEIRTGLKDGETGLILHVSSSAPQTKLIAPPATLNEDRLEQYYYFIYAFDPSANGNTTKAPVFVGKWTAPLDEEGNPTVVTGTGTEENIPLDKYVDLKENENTYSGYVYILANYKANEEAWDELLAATTPDYSTFTWEYLQGLSLPATFQNYNIIKGDATLWPAEQMNEKQDEGHRFKAQDSFVMASEVKSFTVQKGTPLPIDVKLFRLAAKVSLEVHLAKWYIQNDHQGYKYTWYSDPKRIQVYLNYAADAGTMDGTPLIYKATGDDSNAKDFFTYRRFAWLTDWTKSGDEYVFPDGSYSEKEPLKWIYKEDPAATQPEGGQYYTNDDDYVGKIVEIDGEIKYHEFTRPAYKITGTPFYSYPYDFSGDSGHAPFFKIIVEWTAMNEPADSRATDETAGSGGTPEIISHEFYYKISIPDVKIFEANQWIKLKVNLSTLGSETDEASIDVASDTYFVTDWSDPTDPDIPDITAGRYLNISSLKKDGDHPLFDMYGSKLEIPVSTSHEIEISNVSTSYEIFDSSIRTNTSIAAEIRNHIRNASPYTGFLDESENSSSGYNFTLAYDAEKHIVELQHSPQTAIDALQPKDVAKITYTFTVTHKDNANFTETITVVQYPPMYIIADPNSGGTSSSTRGYVYINMEQNTTNSRWDYVRSNMNAGDDTNTNSNMYVVSVSVLESGSNNLIGDPRGSNTLTSGTPAWNSGPSTLGETRTLSSDYGRAENSTQAEITIAPKIRVASSWGAAANYTFANASRRCASYQEDGLPAGRWRLPTTAEIKFLVSLSSRHLLPRLFGTQSGTTTYWSSNGSVTVNTSTGDVSDTRGASDNSNTTNYIRCVYDEWYWGETTNSSPIRAQYRNTPTWGDEPR